MSLTRYLARTAAFALLHLLATAAGLATAVGGGVHLFWPAAAVGAVWLVAQARAGRRGLDVVALTVTAALVPTAAGHELLNALALAAPQVVPAVVFAWLVERWLPGYWLGHGERFRRTGPSLARLAVAAATAAVAGAALQHLLQDGELTTLDTGYLLLRDTVAVGLTVLAVRAVRATAGRAPSVVR